MWSISPGLDQLIRGRGDQKGWGERAYPASNTRIDHESRVLSVVGGLGTREATGRGTEGEASGGPSEALEGRALEAKCAC